MPSIDTSTTAATVTEDRPAFYVEPDELPYREAFSAYQGISFTPEKRAHQQQAEYAGHLNELFARLSSLANTDEARAQLLREMERYREGFDTRFRAHLAAKSRTLSPMISGPARFPTERNRKALNTETRRWEELRDWMERAQAAIRRKLVPEEARAISSDDPNAPERLAAKLAELEAVQETMKEANAVIRRHKRAASAIPELMALGLSERQSGELLKSDSVGRYGFPDYALSNNGAEIRRVRTRIKGLAARSADIPREWRVTVPGVGDVRVIDNVEANRLQIVFGMKPPQQVRDAMKGRGFRWAPSHDGQPWQRQRSTGARWAAEEVLGVKLTAAAAQVAG
jgi:hypothetical protein